MQLRKFFRESDLVMKGTQLLLLSILSAAVFTGITIIFTGGNLEDIADLRLTQALQSVGIFIITPLLLAMLWSDKPMHYLGMASGPTVKYLLLTVLLMISVIPLINFLGEWNSKLQLPEFMSEIEILMKDMEARAAELTARMLQAGSLGELLLNIGLIAVLPAIGEELFFRGIIQNTLSRKIGVHAAVWISALIFSIIHFQFYGFIPRLLLGALLGYLLVWSGSLWIPILAHFINNGLAVLYFYFKERYEMPVDIEKIGNSDTMIVSLFSLFVVILLITLLSNPGQKVDNQD